MTTEQALAIVQKAIDSPTPMPKAPPEKSLPSSSNVESEYIGRASLAFIISGVSTTAHYENTGYLLDSLFVFVFTLVMGMFFINLARDLAGYEENRTKEDILRLECERASRNHYLACVMWEESHHRPLVKAVQQIKKANPELGISVDGQGIVTMNPNRSIKLDLLGIVGDDSSTN